jgi:hypothetical protein
LGELLEPNRTPVGEAPVNPDAWVNAAKVVAIEETGRGADPAHWEPYRVEACGATLIAFFVERGEGVRPFRWAIGDSRMAPQQARVGVAASLADPEVAVARAFLPICVTIVDQPADRDGVMTALEDAEGAWVEAGAPNEQRDFSQATIVDVSPFSREAYTILLERPEGIQSRLNRVTISVDGDGTYSVRSHASDVGMATPLNVYRDVSTDVYFGLTDDAPVAAVDLLGRGTRLRYPIESPGFIIDADLPDGLRTFEILDVAGRVIAEGEVLAWPPER